MEIDFPVLRTALYAMAAAAIFTIFFVRIELTYRYILSVFEEPGLKAYENFENYINLPTFWHMVTRFLVWPISRFDPRNQ